MTYPPAKIDVYWSKNTQVFVLKKPQNTPNTQMFDLKLLVLSSWQGFYSPIDPKTNPHLCQISVGLDISHNMQVQHEISAILDYLRQNVINYT